MIPFLNHKKVAGTILSLKKGKATEVAREVEAPESDMDPSLLSAAADLIGAIDSKSSHDVAAAFKAMFEVCESYESPEPSEEEAL